jgi:phospholipid/cholesterol/gamma-HCH transport system ATP-binding protein
MSVIVLEGVNVSFNKNEPLLSNVNLAVRRGETLVILGSSGAGKSVFLKTVAGLILPNSGRVQIEPGLNLGMVFQKNALFDSLSVGENLAFPLRESSSLNEKEIQDRVLEGLKNVELGHAKDLLPHEMSGGMQKRLGIARALVLRPEIILYDDPTAGLDPITSKIIIELILRLKKEFGTTVIAVTNDMNRAYQMGDRISMIINGSLVVMGSPEETKNFSDARVQNFIRGEGGDGATN